MKFLFSFMVFFAFAPRNEMNFRRNASCITGQVFGKLTLSVENRNIFFRIGCRPETIMKGEYTL